MTPLINRDVNFNVKKECSKTEQPFNNRKEEVMAIRSKFPNKIPIIVEKYHRESILPSLDKKKFLVPEEVTMSQFSVIVRNRIELKPTQTLYLIINNRSMLSMSLTMAVAYAQHRDEDGYLNITYASEDMFGYQDIKMASIEEIQAIRHRFPDKIPLYVKRYAREKEMPVLGRNKFLVPQEITMSQFLYIIRNKLKLRETQALYLLVNDKVMINSSVTLAQAYQQYGAADGYLHVTYAAQQVFG